MFMLHNVQCSVQLMLFLIKKIIFFFFLRHGFALLLIMSKCPVLKYT